LELSQIETFGGIQVQQAKPLLVDTAVRSRPETVKMGRDDQPAPGPDRIVPLFGNAEPTASGQGQEGVAEHDWLATLDLVRQASAKVKQTDESSREVARNAQAYMQHANEKVEEARTRAEMAEAATRTAEKRAQEAELRAIEAEERSQAAERRAQAFQAQAQDAETRAKDAQAWAKRLHLALKQEFSPPETNFRA
jgi:septal ring factor EnvC (AmiA/AmiB activator)